ncbi:hypothetical protein AB0P21_24675 [Kribbella sp. NPDC056861]|uniref:hypothetical protein n=1 Tax=Kribbella sp. NPDC056861 TaxID=3154857 RepID=UPI00342AE4E0
MAHHDASTVVDVAPAILFDYLAKLPEMPELGELQLIEENRTLRWGSRGYHGELVVDLLADGASRLTVRLDTDHPNDPGFDEELSRALDLIRLALEQPVRIRSL